MDKICEKGEQILLQFMN